MSKDLKADLQLAVDAARAGGELAAQNFGRDMRVWEKAKGDPVSEIDIAVNDLIAQQLRSARPSYGWLSEETKDNTDRLDKQRLWVIDPIDGTRAYIKGRPEYCVSIACVEAGRPVVAALYDPSANEMYTAMAGGGAWRNDVPLRASTHSDALTARLVLAPDMAGHAYWPQPWAPRSLVRPNSMALRIAWVATGEHDLTMALSTKQDWDLAAADLILSEAGGRMTDQDGTALNYNAPSTGHPFVVGGAPGVHDVACAQLRGLIATYRAKHPVSR